MSRVKIFALGGVGENGKNLYVVEVDKDIFVLDAGLKYPEDESFGIDRVLPKYDYLVKNIKRIKGVFLSHGHLDNIGALPEIIQELPDIPVYGTRLTIEILKLALEDAEVNANNLKVIRPYQKISFGKNSVFPVRLTHSIPDSVGYAINTQDGVVFYSTDYVFDQTAKGHYHTDVGKLGYIGKQGVLCLLNESLGAEREGHTSPRHRTDKILSEAFYNAQDRIIIPVFSSNIYRLQEIFDEVKLSKRRVAILGIRLQKIVDKSIELGYLDFDKKNLASIKDIGKNDEDLVVIVSGKRDRPFSAMDRISKGYDKFVKLRDTDTVIFAAPFVPGTEKIGARVNDQVHKSNADVVVISYKKYLSLHPSQEDLMLMLNLMSPKYLVPIKGDYRYQVAHTKAAEKTGYDIDNILIIGNGEVLEFVDGKLVNRSDKVPTGDILIDSRRVGSVGDLVLRDREILSEDGIVVVSATICKQSKKLVAGPEILTRGFIYVKENTELIDKISEMASECMVKNTKGTYFDFNQAKQDIRSKLAKHLFDETKRKPMIITMVQEV